MCGTARSGNSQTCSYCGYIFEDQLVTNADSVERAEIVEAPVATSMMGSGDEGEEVVLESQPAVMSRSPKGTLQGTLILTRKRIALVSPVDAQKLSSELDPILRKAPLVIPIDSVDSVSGQRGILRTSLVIDWHNPPGSASTIRTEFLQRARPPSAKEKALNEWAPLIEKQVWGEPAEESSGSTDLNELESRVLEMFTTPGWVGYFQLSRELEEKYETSLDPDDLDKVLEKLVREKILEKEKIGEFFRKVPPGSKN